METLLLILAIVVFVSAGAWVRSLFYDYSRRRTVFMMAFSVAVALTYWLLDHYGVVTK